MTPSRVALLQVILLVVTAALAYSFALFTDRISGGDEGRYHRLVNTAIQRDLCARIAKDLSDFRAGPTTFRRTSPQTIESETRALLRPYLRVENIPDSFPIEYTGSRGKYYKCEEDLLRWLEIPSTGRYSRAEELAFARGDSPLNVNRASSEASAPSGDYRRVALVVGNSNYLNQPLRNPKNDADDMAGALKGIGFDVILLKDATTESMRMAFEQFLSRLLKDEVGFIYLSGHGVEYRGRNYFLPVNARFSDPDEIPRFAFDVTQMIERMSRAGDKLSILVLDACRNSPVLSNERDFRQGLATMQSKKGALIGFSTSPGTIAEDGAGRNSPYTKHLIRNLQRKGLRIEDVFKQTARDVETETAGRQIPWYSSSLLANISLH